MDELWIRENRTEHYILGRPGASVLLRLECPELRLGLDSGGEGGDFVDRPSPPWLLVKDGSLGVGGLD